MLSNKYFDIINELLSLRESQRDNLRTLNRVLARGRMNSCLIEFSDNKQREIVSGNALRKKEKENQNVEYV